MTDIDEARAALVRLGAEVDCLAAVEAETADIERLGGLTNLVFRVTGSGRSYCLRLPGAGTEEYIDRANEADAARAAAAAGVSPEVIYADPETGIMLSTFLDGVVTMTPDRFGTVAGAPARAGAAFRMLHTSDAEFAFRFDLFSMIDEYLGILAGKTVKLPEGYSDALDEAAMVRAALAAKPAPLAPCHCDPLCENFLDTGQRMWIVDWEYSGMNDPMWDLADLSVEGVFGPAQEAEMIRAYFGREPTAQEGGRILVYKAMCDLLWTLWGLIQHANHNPAEDFWAYATGRFERCRALMATPDFAASVAALREAD